MNRTWLPFVVLLLGLFWSVAAVSQDPADNPDLLTQFQQTHNVTTMLFDERGVPTYIEGTLSPKGTQGDVTATAYRFFEETRSIFGMAEPRNELSLVRTKQDELNMSHLFFQQSYKGLNVYGYEYIAHFSPKGDLETVNGTFLPGITIGTEPAVSRETGVQTTLADIRTMVGDAQVGLGKTSLQVFEFEGTIHLAWIIRASVENPPGEWEYFIDAMNGSVIYKANRIMDQEATGIQKKKLPTGDNALVQEKAEGTLNQNSESPSAPDNDPIKYAPNENPPPLDFGWTLIANETYEGIWPAGLWRAFRNGGVHPDAYWDDQSYKRHGGSWAAWMADGGTQAVNPASGAYLDNMDSWMVYGPFDLTNATAADFDFYWAFSTEQNYDWISVMTSTNGINFYGYKWSGNSSGWPNWESKTYDMTSLCGRSQVWIAFVFTSDATIHNKPGVFIDDVRIWKYFPTVGDYIGTGIGVMGNSWSHVDAYHTSAYNLLDRTRRANNNIHGHNGAMRSDQSIVTRNYPSGSAMTDDDNIWNATNQRPGVDAHMYAGITYDYLRTAFGRNSYDNAGTGMLSEVQNSTTTNNASWNGSRVTYFTVTSGHRSMAGALDIAAHEWGHGVTQYESNLIYQKEPGALNESFSDMLGISAGFATGIDPDWIQGENYNVSGAPIRNLATPHACGQPDTYIDDPNWFNVVGCTPSGSNDYCGVHRNSGVPNKAFYLLSVGGYFNGVNVTGIGTANAMKVMYRANAYYWTSSTTFMNAKAGCMTAAYNLGGTTWQQRAGNAWLAVKVGPVITVTPTTAIAFGNQAVGTNSALVVYTIAGRNLLGNLTVTVSAPFKISSNGTTWTTSIAFVPSSGTVSTRTIYVRFDPTAVGAIGKTIAHLSPGAVSIVKGVSGTGTANAVLNPGFELGTANWTFATTGVGSFTSVTPGSRGLRAGRVYVSTQGSSTNLYQQNLTLTAGVQYRVRFYAKSSSGHDVAFAVEKQVSPYPSYGCYVNTTNLGTAWGSFSKTFTASGFSGTVTNARLRFIMGPFDAAGDQFFFDEVVLERATTELAAEAGGEGESIEETPTTYALLQNYPNPFNPTTTIEYTLPVPSAVDMRIYNPLGQQIAVLVSEPQIAGRHSVDWVAENFPSGVYYCRMWAGKFSQTIKLVLVK